MYRLYSSSFSAIGRLTDRCSTFYENKEKSFNYQVFFSSAIKKEKGIHGNCRVKVPNEKCSAWYTKIN